MKKQLSAAQSTLCVAICCVLIWGIIVFFRGHDHWTLDYSSNSKDEIEVKIIRENNVVATLVLEETNLTTFKAQVVRLDRENQSLPLGKVEFQDLTTLPGRVRFSIGNNIVDIMPKKIILNGDESFWNETKSKRIILR